jgi:hypothetical protein
MAYKIEKDEKPTPPRIPSSEEQFDPKELEIGGWCPSEDPHESPIVELPGDGGIGITDNEEDEDED